MLSDYAENIYSYSGEDGMIAELCRRLSLENGYCVEFGAADGVESSNTLALRQQGWRSFLIEADEDKFQKLQACASLDTEVLQTMIKPVGPHSLDELIDQPVDLMSIDVDGDDYQIFESLWIRPTILIIEYNQSIPWFMDVRAASLGNRFGASALSFYRLAEQKQFSLVGVTETNLFFVADEYAQLVEEFVEPYELIMSQQPLRCGIVVSDYTAQQTQLNMGNLPKWGWRSSLPKDELVFGSPWYPQDTRAISDRFRQERVGFGAELS